MESVSNSFVLMAMLNGTTLCGFVRVDNLPLVQRYKSGTDQFVPDFEALAENARPVAYPFIRMIDTGEVVTPRETFFRYNGIQLVFDKNTFLSTNGGMVGVFKLIPEYPVVVGSNTYRLPAIRIMKNLVPLSSYDNDLITVAGTVELGGQQIPFDEMHKEVVIEESTGNQYDVLITNDKGSQLMHAADSLTEKANVYKDGIAVTDLAGLAFKWYKVTGVGGTLFGGTTSSQVVKASDVDNVLKVRCNVSKDGTLLASGFDEVTDFSDPYDIAVDITGITGIHIRKGETAIYKLKVIERGTGNVVPGFIFKWTIKNNAGENFIPTGQTSHQFTADSASFTYADSIRAGRAINIYVTAVKS